MSSKDLAGDVAGAEQLLEQHEELGRANEELCRQAQDVKQKWQQLVDSGHSTSLEVHSLALRWARSPVTRGLRTPSRSEVSRREKPG